MPIPTPEIAENGTASVVIDGTRYNLGRLAALDGATTAVVLLALIRLVIEATSPTPNPARIQAIRALLIQWGAEL